MALIPWRIIIFVDILVIALKSEQNYTCKNNQKLEGKIVGGAFAEIKQFPHSVYLSASCHDDAWGCGSSILTDAILLTAAHCLYGCVGRFHVDAFAGTADVEHVNYVRQVKNYITHERYDQRVAFCDIALTMLKKPLILGSTTKRVIVRRSFQSESDAFMAGWGDVSDDGQETFYLKQVLQKVRPSAVCGKHISLLWGMMCASSGTAEDYPASGDSGSALITKDFQQIGIVSMKARGQGISVVVYSNVSYFYDWIQEKSILLRCAPPGHKKS